MGFKLYDDYTAFEHYWAYINGADDYNTFLALQVILILVQFYLPQ